MGTLYVVATPIGNLEDLSPRAVRVLREVALIAAEDTRHSRRLLAHFAIKTPTVSYHEHNQRARRELPPGSIGVRRRGIDHRCGDTGCFRPGGGLGRPPRSPPDTGCRRFPEPSALAAAVAHRG